MAHLNVAPFQFGRTVGGRSGETYTFPLNMSQHLLGVFAFPTVADTGPYRVNIVLANLGLGGSLLAQGWARNDGLILEAVSWTGDQKLPDAGQGTLLVNWSNGQAGAGALTVNGYVGIEV